MLNDEGRKLIADQQERIDAMRALKKFSTRTASDSASATDSCARCLGSSLTEADQQLVANQRHNYNLPAGGVVYYNKEKEEYLRRKAAPLVRDGTLMLNSKTEGEYFRRLAARDDTAASLLQLVERDEIGWDEYERRLEAVLRREEAKAKRPQGFQGSIYKNALIRAYSLLAVVLVMAGLFVYAMQQTNLANKLKHEQFRTQQVYRRATLYRSHQMRELLQELVALQRKSP